MQPDRGHLIANERALDLSVVICTRNRADLLDRALGSIHHAHAPAQSRWELLVVDNGSTDRTTDVALSWADRLPLRYLYELEPGLSAARNRAMSEARGRLLVFTDDDVEVDPDWLIAMERARRRWPEAGYLAGRIVPSYEGGRPAWLTDACESLLAGVVIRYSPERGPGPLPPDAPRPMGANLAFDADALRGVGGFRTDLGRKGTSLVGGEEVAVLDALERAGLHGAYVPGAVVYHHTPRDRLGWEFLHRYFIGVGVAAVRMGHVGGRGRLGPPRWMLRKLLSTGLRYLYARLTGPLERRIERMRSLGFYRGATRELLRSFRGVPLAARPPVPLASHET